jgi:hypothetical protein
MGKTLLKIIFTYLCILFLSGCGSIDRAVALERQNSELAVYALKKLLSQVQIGMTEAQVINLLGNPPGYDVGRTATVKSETLTYTGPSLFLEVGRNLWSCDYSTINQYQYYCFIIDGSRSLTKQILVASRNSRSEVLLTSRIKIQKEIKDI